MRPADEAQRATTRLVHFIKHGQPIIAPGVASHDWALAERGHAQAREAASLLRNPKPAVVVSSEEVKARATAEVIAQELGVACHSMLGLHEQLRYTAPLVASAEAFRACVHGVLARPAERVFGDETGDQAHARFQVAVAAVLARHAGDVAIVAHGTVMSLLLSRANRCDPIALWDRLSDLSILTVSWPSLHWAVASPT